MAYLLAYQMPQFLPLDAAHAAAELAEIVGQAHTLIAAHPDK